MELADLDWLTRMAFAWILRGNPMEFETELNALIGALLEEHELRRRRHVECRSFLSVLAASCASLATWVLGDKWISEEGGDVGLAGISVDLRSFAAACIKSDRTPVAVLVRLASSANDQQTASVTGSQIAKVHIEHFTSFEKRRNALRDRFRAALSLESPEWQELPSAGPNGLARYPWRVQLILSWCIRERGGAFIKSRQLLLNNLELKRARKARDCHWDDAPSTLELLEKAASRLCSDLFEPKTLPARDHPRIAAAELPVGAALLKPDLTERLLPVKINGDLDPQSALIHYTIDPELHEQFVVVQGRSVGIYPNASQEHRQETVHKRVATCFEQTRKDDARRMRSSVGDVYPYAEIPVAPEVDSFDLFQLKFLRELGWHFPKVLIHVLVTRKVYRNKVKEGADLNSAKDTMAELSLVNVRQLAEYFKFLESAENWVLTYRHERALAVAQALFRSEMEWNRKSRLVPDFLQGIDPR